MVEVLSSLGPQFQMWVVFAIIVAALIGYASAKVPMEVTSIGVICALMLFFQLAPVDGDYGRLSPARILQGFANPALITVLALLVMGEGIARTGILDRAARFVLRLGGGRPWLAILIALAAVLIVSGFMNNIPVVVIFIPILRALASRFGMHIGKVMIPLSYAAVLGGMTTLVGSSTNLLVNGALLERGMPTFGFFDFTVTGCVLAAVGLVYLLFIAPRLLPERAGFTDELIDRSGTQFIAQLTISSDSELIGEQAPAGMFVGLPDMTVRLVQRGEDAILPPFENLALRAGDVIVVAATRKTLTDALARDPGLLFPLLQEGGEADAPLDDEDPDPDDSEPWRDGEQVLAEAMVTPSSRLIGHTLTRIKFRYRTGCIVLGIQRRARMFRTRLTDIRLEAGDVLLLQGRPEAVARLRGNGDVLLIEWSQEDLPALDHARRASGVFVGMLALAAFEILPIVAATLTGAVLMVGLGVLNIRHAVRAVDPNVVTTIGVALALGVALTETGGAAFVASVFVEVMRGSSPQAVLSAFFILLAVLSNIISTKTTAVLFTPIAVDIALQMGVAPQVFAVAVIFAANCSFASPIGYQTNLLVMGPGHYRFGDFAKVGAPLIVVLWAAFSLFAPWYYGL
jgi:di/tricarboxylate transporter